MFHKVFSFLSKENNSKLERLDSTTPFYNLPKDKKDKYLKDFFANIPTIETERLSLRRIYPSDFRDVFEYSSDPEVTKYLTWHPHKNIAESSEYAQYVQKRYTAGKFYDWGLQNKMDGKLIGTCGFTAIDLDANKCEIGYVLSRKYWGQGLVPEACQTIIKYAFCYFGFDFVIARFIDGNTKSMKVMQKCGMVFDITLNNWMRIKGEYKTIHQYKITKERYFSMQTLL